MATASVKELNQPCQRKATFSRHWVVLGLMSHPGLGCSCYRAPCESFAFQQGVRGRGSPGMDEGLWCGGGNQQQKWGSRGLTGVLGYLVVTLPLGLCKASSLPFSHLLITGLGQCRCSPVRWLCPWWAKLINYLKGEMTFPGWEVTTGTNFAPGSLWSDIPYYPHQGRGGLNGTCPGSAQRGEPLPVGRKSVVCEGTEDSAWL